MDVARKLGILVFCAVPAIVGGGSGMIRPGAAARAAHGVLFLDDAKDRKYNRILCSPVTTAYVGDFLAE